MVDALEKIRSLLQPSGLLISIQPQDENLPISVQVGQTATYVGEVDVSPNFTRYQQANAALEIVLESGRFVIERDLIVDYYVYFDTIAACREYLAEDWTDANLPDKDWERITTLLKAAEGEDKYIFYSEKVRFCCLTPS